jgi:protein-L-isoaspartate O-methyltransferase
MVENHFTADVARRYDANSAAEFAPDVIAATVTFLANLAQTGAALELGVGTGRVALPLSRRGVEVHGMDLSPEMIDELRAKPGAEDIEITIGDIAVTRLRRSFSLVYLVFNTIMNLTTQGAQVACFVNAAAHLDPGGHFVVEVAVPPVQRLARGETVVPFALTHDHVGFDEVDVATQSLTSHHYRFRDGHYDALSIPFRYVWPSELDLMARIAGLTLVERWATWNREPFTSESEQHISVWRKNPDRAP